MKNKYYRFLLTLMMCLTVSVPTTFAEDATIEVRFDKGQWVDWNNNISRPFAASWYSTTTPAISICCKTGNYSTTDIRGNKFNGGSNISTFDDNQHNLMFYAGTGYNGIFSTYEIMVESGWYIKSVDFDFNANEWQYVSGEPVWYNTGSNSIKIGDEGEVISEGPDDNKHVSWSNDDSFVVSVPFVVSKQSEKGSFARTSNFIVVVGRQSPREEATEKVQLFYDQNKKYLKDGVTPVGPFPGQYDEDLFNSFKNLMEEWEDIYTMGDFMNMGAEEIKAIGSNLKATFEALIASRVPMTLSNGFYRIRSAHNFAQAKYLCAQTGSTINAIYTSPEHLDTFLPAIWKVENRNGLFDVMNVVCKARFNDVAQGSSVVTLSVESDSLIAIDPVNTENNVTRVNIRLAAQPANDYKYFHCVNWSSSPETGNITLWSNEPTSSEWIFEPVTTEELLEGKLIKNIDFADENVKAICVENWDTDGDGELSFAEAAAVTSLGEVFKNNTSITSFNELQFFYNLTSIDHFAFYGCSSLTSIAIPKNVSIIGNYVFYDCNDLTSIVVDNENNQYDSRDNCNAIIVTESNTLIVGCKSTNIPNSVTSIGLYALYGCSSLTSITIPNSITMINDGAFRGCSGLTSVTIPNSVISIGRFAFQGCSNLTSVTINSNDIASKAYQGSSDSFSSIFGTQVKNYVLGDDVQSIGEYACFGCSGLTSVTIGNSVTKIGKLAFKACSDLTTVIIGNSVTEVGSEAFNGTAWYDNQPDGLVYVGRVAYKYKGTMPANTEIILKSGTQSITSSAFSVCYGLTSIIIPNSVTSIGGNAFYGCSGLTSVSIPNSVISISSSSFSDCNGLTSIVVENDNTVYDSRNGCNAIIETASNTLIKGCMNTIIPDGVTIIGENAFAGTHGLTTIVIPQSVTSISFCAFTGCQDLASIIIPEGVVTIGDAAFGACSSLTSITIPKTVTNIGAPYQSGNAFYSCSNLSSIVVEDGNTVYDSRNGCNAIIETATNTLLTGCRNTIIPKDITKIGSQAFSGCSGLTSIIIPNGVTYISNVAFSQCSDLTSVTIPESITNINTQAFWHCDNLSMVKIGAKTPIYISNNVFTNQSHATLCVPRGSKAAYEAANVWKDFKEIIEFNYVDVANQAIIEGESASIDIGLDNDQDNLVAFQMDLTLPEGVSLDKSGCSLSSRITDEKKLLTIGKLEDNVYRLTSTSMSLTPISGNSGSLLTLKLTAKDNCEKGQAMINNIIFSTSDSKHVAMNDETFDINILYKYKLTYIVDNEEYKTDSVAETMPLTPEVEPTKKGYTFSGWSEIPNTMPARDVVITGIFTINKYLLTYMVDDKVYKTDSIAETTPLTLEAEPTKEGYTFSGWSELPDSMPDHDVVITGSFIVNNYTLTYKVDDEEYKTTTVAYGTMLIAEEYPTKEGYTFSGWSEIPDSMPAHDVEVVGSFSINSYTLTYKVDGEVYKSSIVVFNTALTLEEEPAKEGYTFGGWSELPETMPAHNVDITGRFYLYGDVNTDESVDVVDVVDIARFVISNPSDIFREKLADLNCDNSINLGDAVVLVNHIAGDVNFVKPTLAPYKATGNNDMLRLTNTGQALTLSLTNNREYTAFQFDLNVLDNTEVEDMLLSAKRSQMHTLLYNKVDDGVYRVAVFSTSNLIFSENEGELLSFVINNSFYDNVSVSDIHFFDIKGKGYSFGDLFVEDATGIRSIDNSQDMIDQSYDLSGRKLSKPQRGVNIIRMKDGSTHKDIRR